MATTTDIRVSVQNTSGEGGTFLTPVYVGFHNGNFDLFESGQAASPGLEQLAEDGSPAGLAGERLAASPGSQGLVVTGDAGPIATEELTSGTTSIDGETNTDVSLAAMILPSNDAFIGTNDSVELFDENGNFLGAQTLVFSGSNVYDAGTEVNTELDAAFINQMAPNTGIDENGVVHLHPGFNGSFGNPVGDGDQIILGGTNALGDFIDPEVADFTLPGAEIAVVHINTVIENDFGNGNDAFAGTDDDNIVTGGNGNDFIEGSRGWDVLSGGADNDILRGEAGNDVLRGNNGNDALDGGINTDYLFGGNGNDFLEGGNGDDELRGAGGLDELIGGLGADFLDGGRNADLLDGGLGNDEAYGGGGNDEIYGREGGDFLAGNGGIDILYGGGGQDVFAFAAGDDDDIIGDFSNQDTLQLDVSGITDFNILLAQAAETGGGVLFDFGSRGSVFLEQTDIDDLDASQFAFV